MRITGVADQTDQKAQPQQVASGTNKANYFFAFLLILATVLLYGHSLRYPLVFDDLPFFVDPLLRQLGNSSFHLDLRWFPYASFGWTYNLFGQDWFWYRLGNVALHSVTTILLFIFFSRVLDAVLPTQGIDPQPRWLPFFAALIFALHPVAVYGVAYLVQRSILMATLFSIAALLCYLEGFIRGKARWFVISAIFYFLAVFSKEHSIMAPGVAAALTLLLRKPSFDLAKKVWLPFALYLVIAIFVILRTKGLLGTAYEPSAAGILFQLSEQQEKVNIENAYGLSVISQGYLFFKYLLLWTVPYTGWMSVDIRQPLATHFLSWPQLPGFMLFLAYPLLAMKLLLKGGRQGLLGFGLLFPWILYLTELSTIRIQEPFVLYRSYLWMSGLPVMLLAIPGSVPKKILAIGLPVLCLGLAALAWNRLDTFSSDLKIWSDAIAKHQGNNPLFIERSYVHRGNAYAALDQLPAALADFEKAIELNPRYAYAYNNSARVYANQNNLVESLRRYDTAIELKPNYGTAYANRADVLIKMGRYAEAFMDIDRAIQLSPRDPSNYSNRAGANFHLGKFIEALSDLDWAIQLNPRDPDNYSRRAITNLNLGKFQAALNDYDAAIKLKPDYIDAFANRGDLLLKMGRHIEALSDFDRVIQLSPGDPAKYSNRARANFQIGKFAEALSDLDRAIQLSPGNPSYYTNRASINSNLGKFQEAQSDYVRALNLYDEALTADANNSKVLLKRGFVLNALNRKTEASKSFRRSCKAGNPEACQQLR